MPKDHKGHRVYINPRRSNREMPLQRILQSLDSPVRREVTQQIITYMKHIPHADGQNAELISQCVSHLETNQTLGAMLAVVHALNNGEFLLRSHAEVDEQELSDDFEALFKNE